MDEIEKEVCMVNNTLLRPVPILNKRKKVYQHDTSPEWQDIVDSMLTEIKLQEKKFM
jgi:hypothetical protein